MCSFYLIFFPNCCGFSCVQLFVTLWTVACQAPLSMGFSRQEYWSGLPFPSPGDLPDPGIEPRSPALQADALTSEPRGKPFHSFMKAPYNYCISIYFSFYFCWYLLYVFRYLHVSRIHASKCYIFLLDWPLSHYSMPFLFLQFLSKSLFWLI